MILRSGVVFTADSSLSVAEAVAIRNGHVLHVGSNNDMGPFWGPNTDIIELNGRLVCPGFNDAHCHIADGARGRLEVDISGLSSIREIQNQVLRAARRYEAEMWILGRGWDQTLLPDERWPDKRMLDRIVPAIPVFLKRACGDAALCNSLALRIADIDEDTQNPPGGVIEKDPRTGRLTGILKGTALDLVEQYIPPVNQTHLNQEIAGIVMTLPSLGITSIQDNSNKEMLSVYQQLLNERRLPIRVAVNPPIIEHLVEYRPLRRDFARGRVQFGYLSGQVDGSLASETAFLFDSYFNRPHHRGQALVDRDLLNQMVILSDRERFQVGLQASGDAGTQMTLNAMILASRINDAWPRRFRMEHMNLIRPGILPHLREFNVIASVQPGCLLDDIRWLDSRLGASRCQFTMAWRTLLENDIPLAFGSDWPVGPLNPLLGIYAAVTRSDTLGLPPGGWISEQRLTVKEALFAYTAGSAFAEMKETEKGSIEPGKLADLVVIDRDLLSIPPNEILDAKVDITLLGGKRVYQRE